MSAEIIRFPTRRRKAFRADWLEMNGLPHNCYEFKSEWMETYFRLKKTEWVRREQIATEAPGVILPDLLPRLLRGTERTIENYFGPNQRMKFTADDYAYVQGGAT